MFLFKAKIRIVSTPKNNQIILDANPNLFNKSEIFPINNEKFIFVVAAVFYSPIIQDKYIQLILKFRYPINPQDMVNSAMEEVTIPKKIRTNKNFDPF